MATIKIYSGDTSTKRLKLSDCGHTWVNKGKSIKWKIKDPKSSNVACIDDIVVRSGAEIFSEIPAKKDGKWKAKVAGHARGNAECKYSIFWIPKGASEALEDDPKISVNPSYTHLLIPIIAVAGILGLGLWFSKISNKSNR